MKKTEIRINRQINDNLVSDIKRFLNGVKTKDNNTLEVIFETDLQLNFVTYYLAKKYNITIYIKFPLEKVMYDGGLDFEVSFLLLYAFEEYNNKILEAIYAYVENKTLDGFVEYCLKNGLVNEMVTLLSNVLEVGVCKYNYTNVSDISKAVIAMAAKEFKDDDCMFNFYDIIYQVFGVKYD